MGFYGYEHEKDTNGQTPHLLAQMIWYFVDGYLNRYMESPEESKDDFLKFITSQRHSNMNIVFYKSTRTDRWWMEIPVGDNAANTHIMPCSYNDYLAATREEIPDRWLQAVKKFS
jgi:formiminoglutamase